MTRVLFVHHGIGLGGAPISLANIIAALDRTSYEPLVLMRPSQATVLMQEAGAEVLAARQFPIFRHTTAGGYWIADPRLLRQWIGCFSPQHGWRQQFSAIEPDIVHLNSLTLLPLCRPARAAGARVVISIRETVLAGSLGFRRRWIANYLTRHCDAVIHISDYDRRLLGVRSPIVEVVPNWVDLTRFDRTISGEPIRRELGLTENQHLIVTFGGATPIKGTLDFLRAASRLGGQADLVFGIVGMDAPKTAPPRAKRLVKAALNIDMREQISEFVERHLQGASVRFLGVRRDIPAVLAASSVLVFPATRPHQARPVFEAGAMAKPVIATDFDCIHEDVANGQNGLLVPSGDPQALADAIVEIVYNPDRANEMGEANYRRTAQMHNQQINAPKIETIYDRLLRLQPVHPRPER